MKRCILFLAVVMACWSCQDRTVEFGEIPTVEEKKTPRGDIGIHEISSSDFLLMQIVPSTISSHSTNKFVIVNRTANELFWNTIFTLEYLENNGWQEIPILSDWIDIGYVLEPDEIFSSEIFVGDMTLYSMVGNFNNGKKGMYRISRSMSIPDMGRYVLYAEFEVI